MIRVEYGEDIGCGIKWTPVDLTCFEQGVINDMEVRLKETFYSNSTVTTEVGTAVPGAAYWNIIGNTATPTCAYKKCASEVKKEEGNNPMRYDTVTVAPSISIEAGATEAATQREYLLKRLDKIERSFAYGPKWHAIREIFGYGKAEGPRNFKELIDAIKNGKYTIDPKVEKRLARHLEAAADGEYDLDGDDYYFGMTEGIKWTDFPGPDYEGMRAANEAVDAKAKEVKDAIMIQDPKDALADLQAFENWMPTKATDTAQ